jgi:alpha-mannosidase
VDAKGNPVDFCITESGNGYWGHVFTKLQVRASVPAFGYTTLILRQKADEGHVAHEILKSPRSDEYINDEPLVLENAYIKAVFEANTLCLVSLTDKKTGKELISEPSCYFRYADENPRYGMTSWRVGPYMHTVNLNRAHNVRVYETVTDPVCSKISYELKFGASVLRASVLLKKNSKILEYALNIDWNEGAVQGEKIPQISFAVPVSYSTTGKARYDIPYGEVERDALAHDVPALSYLAMDGMEDNCVGVVSDCKYGYRYSDNCGSVTLIRSAYDPDPYPDRGLHTIRLGVMVCPMADMRHQASLFNHPMPFVAGTGKVGTLPLESSFLNVGGNVEVSCVKNAEAEDGVVVRVFDKSGKPQNARLCLAKPVQKACITDSNENTVAEVQVREGVAEFAVDAYATVTVKVIF